MPTQKTTKLELLQKSIQMFREQGYYRTNMSDLAKYCGLTKGAFYHHFKNKEDVMRQSLELTTVFFRKHIFSVAQDDEIPDDQKLKVLLDRYFHQVSKDAGGCFMANTILETFQVETTFKSIVADFFQFWETALTNIFTTKYNQTVAKEKSIQVITDIEGAIILSLLHTQQAYLKNAIERCKKLY